jgi:hypothetical protein
MLENYEFHCDEISKLARIMPFGEQYVFGYLKYVMAAPDNKCPIFGRSGLLNVVASGIS